MLRVLIATDCHLGYLEKDEIRRFDSFQAFEEICSIAEQNKVFNFVLWPPLCWKLLFLLKYDTLLVLYYLFTCTHNEIVYFMLLFLYSWVVHLMAGHYGCLDHFSLPVKVETWSSFSCYHIILLITAGCFSSR